MNQLPEAPPIPARSHRANAGANALGEIRSLQAQVEQLQATNRALILYLKERESLPAEAEQP